MIPAKAIARLGTVGLGPFEGGRIPFFNLGFAQLDFAFGSYLVVIPLLILPVGSPGSAACW